LPLLQKGSNKPEEKEVRRTLGGHCWARY